MGRLPKIISTTSLLGAALAATTGCETLNKFHESRRSMMVATGLEAPAPANQFLVYWQNQLKTLPDPTKSGAQIAGLYGQMFIFTETSQPAVPCGELTVVVEDLTPRQGGMPAHKSEVWHYTKDKLEKMVAIDEHFGRHVALFVPWPMEWRDVSRVRMKASYTQPTGHKTLYAPESEITLDFVGVTGVWQKSRMGLPTGPLTGVPNSNQLIQQAVNQQKAPPQSVPAQPNGSVVPAAYPVRQQQQQQQPPMTTAPAAQTNPIVPAGGNGMAMPATLGQ